MPNPNEQLADEAQIPEIELSDKQQKSIKLAKYHICTVGRGCYPTYQ